MLVFLQPGLFSGLDRGDWRARSAWTQVTLVPAGSLQRCSGKKVGAGQMEGSSPSKSDAFPDLTPDMCVSLCVCTALSVQCSARMRKAQRSVRNASWSKSVGSGRQVASQGVEYSLFANLRWLSRGSEGRRGLIRIVSRRAGPVVSLAGWMSRSRPKNVPLATWLRSSGRQR
jgi:hypothetical protein